MAVSPPVVHVEPSAAELNVERGVSMELPFSTTLTDGNLVEILDLYPKVTVEQLEDAFRTDGQMRMLYRVITLPIRAALKRSEIVVPERYTSGGTRERDFVENMFFAPLVDGGMSVDFNRVLAQLLLSVVHSFSVFEQVYTVPEVGPFKGFLSLRKLAHRPASSISFLADDTGGFAGVRQRIAWKGEQLDIPFKARDILYYASQEEENPFYGRSYFEPAFYHFDKKRKLYFIAHLAATVRATGGRVAYPEQGAAGGGEDQKVLKAIRDFGLNLGIVLPPGWKLDELGSNLPSVDFILEMVKHHNGQMSKSVLVEFMDNLDQNKSLVDFSETGADDFFILMLKAIMDEIASIINRHLIPKFISWNFTSGVYPEFRWGSFTDEEKQAITTTFEKLAVAPQLNLSPEFMLELEQRMAEELNFDIPYEDEVLPRMEKERELEQQTAEAAAEKATAEADQAKNPPPAPAPGKAQLVAATGMTDPETLRLVDLLERAGEALDGAS